MEEKQNVVFIIVDCLRNDHFLGESSAKTPFLDSLREQGTVFSQAISTTSFTPPCFTSILTGRYSFNHGVRSLFGYSKRTDMLSLAQGFRKVGYKTIAYVTGPLFEDLGLNAGFDEYHFRGHNDTIFREFGKHFFERFSKPQEQPFFLLLHLFELHRPRRMEKSFNKREFGKVAYQRSLSCLDSYLKKIFSCFDENTLFVLSADHAENIPNNKVEEYVNHLDVLWFLFLRRIGLSGSFSYRESHGFDLSEDVLRIPLFFKGNGFPEGKVVSQQVSQVDIAPTLASLFGFSLGDKVDGHNLMPLVRGESVSEWPVFIEARGEKLPNKKEWLEGIRTSHWKFVRSSYESLYSFDEGSRKISVINRFPLKAKDLDKKLRELKSSSLVYYDGKQVELKEHMKGRLKELGYI